MCDIFILSIKHNNNNAPTIIHTNHSED